MVVMTREAWTDERLDKGFERVDTDIRELRMEIRGLRSEIKVGFERVDDEFKAVRAEMKAGFHRVDDEFRELRGEMNARFDSMQRTMIVGFVTLFGSVAASVIGAVFATHL